MIVSTIILVLSTVACVAYIITTIGIIWATEKHHEGG